MIGGIGDGARELVAPGFDGLVRTRIDQVEGKPGKNSRASLIAINASSTLCMRPAGADRHR